MERAIGKVGAAAALLLVLVGSIGAAFALGAVGVPAVATVDNRFASVNDTTTVIATEITVDNPNPVGLTLGDVRIDYVVRLNDIAIANGSKAGVSVDAGTSTHRITTTMANGRIPAWWVSHVRSGEHTTLQVDATVTSGLFGQTVAVTPVERPVETDLLSAFNSTESRPVNADSPLVDDPVLYVNETSASWGGVTEAVTPMELAFVVYNPKPAPYTITEIRYAITMNDVPVGEGSTGREHILPPHTERRVETETAIRNERLDEWWVTHLENDQVTQLRIEFAATVQLPGGATVEVPLDALTYTATIETDFFGNKPPGSHDAGSSPATASPRPRTDGPSPTGNTATPTPTGGVLPVGDIAADGL